MKLALCSEDFGSDEIAYISDILDQKIDVLKNPFEMLMSGKIDVLIKPLNKLAFQSEENPVVIAALLKRLDIHPMNWREKLPTVSEGIFALLCLRNETLTRKKLLTLNDTQTMYCSNVERSIQKRTNLKNIYCFRDRADRYNLGVSSESGLDGKKFFYAQSTFVGLVEQVIKDLKK